MSNDTTSAFGAYAPDSFQELLIALTRRLSVRYPSRKFAFLLRKILILYTGKKPIDVATFGLKMRLYGYDNVAEKRLLYTPQYFDADEREAIATALGNDYVFVDIGANAGGYALFVASLTGKKGKVIAVDPQPAMIERLRYNIECNQLSSVTLVPAALGAEKGEADLYIDEGNRGQASMQHTEHAAHHAGSVKVPVITLLSVLNDVGAQKIDALKIDAEGAEDEIMMPFFSTAPSSLWPRLVVIENTPSRWKVDLLKHMETSGYKLAKHTKLNKIYEYRP